MHLDLGPLSLRAPSQTLAWPHSHIPLLPYSPISIVAPPHVHQLFRKSTSRTSPPEEETDSDRVVVRRDSGSAKKSTPRSARPPSALRTRSHARPPSASPPSNSATTTAAGTRLHRRRTYYSDTYNSYAAYAAYAAVLDPPAQRTQHRVDRRPHSRSEAYVRRGAAERVFPRRPGQKYGEAGH